MVVEGGRDARCMRLHGAREVFCYTGRSSKEQGMVNQKLLDEIGGRIKDVLAQSPAGDIEKNLRAVLQSAFARLDLVTREEFDVQQAVLARTREKLTRLEAKVAELERRNAAPESTAIEPGGTN
jgi:BMFP domain-containing protein YqiC